MTKSMSLAAIFLAFSAQSSMSNDNSFDGLSYRSIDNVDSDDRVEVLPHGFAQTIGILKATEGYICTATLIGENTIITADHCVENDNLKSRKPEEFTFYGGFSDGNFLSESNVVRIIAPEETSATAGPFAEDIRFSFNDIAIMVLEKPLGEIFGYEKLRVKPLPELAEDNRLNLVQIGYNVDFGDIMSADIECHLIPDNLNPEYLTSTCSISFRDSGSPQFAWIENDEGKIERQIIGITSRLASSAGGSIAAPTYLSEIVQNFYPD